MLLTISPKRIKSYETELERNFEHKEDEMKHEQIKSVTHPKILKKNNCFLQKTLYHIIQELCFRNVLSVVVKLNSDLPKKQIPMILTEKELFVLPEESSVFYIYNMLGERNIDQIYFSVFLKCYSYNRKKNIVNLRENTWKRSDIKLERY